MKQLKFMLAAATAIGLATAAQAATQEVKLFGDETPVDTFTAGTPSASLKGYTYLSEDGENDSKVEDGALTVSTGENPLLRALDLQGTTAVPVDMTATDFESLYIDTKVQFTVTPAGDEVDAKSGDKLMIYLAEYTNVVDGVTKWSTNLVVKAMEYLPAGEDEDGEATDPVTNTNDCKVIYTDGKEVKVGAGAWYDLSVKAVVFNGEPMFEIWLGGKQIKPEIILNRNGVTDAEKNYFPALTSGSSSPATLTYVGFAGEGAVDDLTAVKVTVVNSVDFTLTLGDGVSAVTYTIGEDSATITGTTTLEGLEAAKINITAIDYLMGYKAGVNGVGVHNVTSSGLTIDATVVAFNDGQGGGTATTATELGIEGGSFVDATADTLKAVFNWGKGKGVTVSQINKMSFDTYGNPNSMADADKLVEEAYLLNCAPTADALQAAKKAFVFTAEDLAALIKDGVKAGLAVAAGDYNGEVVIQGCDDLATAEWADKAAGDKCNFYRARLMFTK